MCLYSVYRPLFKILKTTFLSHNIIMIDSSNQLFDFFFKKKKLLIQLLVKIITSALYDNCGIKIKFLTLLL
jgi:hypothetical protein